MKRKVTVDLTDGLGSVEVSPVSIWDMPGLLKIVNGAGDQLKDIFTGDVKIVDLVMSGTDAAADIIAKVIPIANNAVNWDGVREDSQGFGDIPHWDANEILRAWWDISFGEQKKRQIWLDLLTKTGLVNLDALSADGASVMETISEGASSSSPAPDSTPA